MILDDITLLTCTFNNNILTSLMIKSLFKQLKREIPVVIMDNGTKLKCTNGMKEVFEVIDNTNYKIIPNYNQVSRNHCASIDYALKNCIKTKYVLLCDNDILYKPGLDLFFEKIDKIQNLNCVGEISKIKGSVKRVLPFFCIMNVELFKTINYFDKNRCMNHCITIFNQNGEYNGRKLLNNKIIYDTGASFYEDLMKNKININEIKLDNLIIHLASASWGKKNYLGWLDKHRNLF